MLCSTSDIQKSLIETVNPKSCEKSEKVIFKEHMMKSVFSSSTVLSVEEIAETDEFVLVKFTEYIDGKVTESYEKGIKDSDGDIVEFIKI